MYYIILAIIALMLFIMRKRIFGGIVGAITLLITIALAIFLLDFFWLGTDFTGQERDVRDFESTKEVVDKYDESVKDPSKSVRDTADKVVSKGGEINKKIEGTGNELDKKLGIQKNEDNNNLWEEGEEGDNEEESDEGIEQENGKSESKIEEEKEGILEKVKNKISQLKSKEEKDSESIESEKVNKSEVKEKGLVEFGDIGSVQEMWDLSDEDFKFVKSASPFNTGTFSNGSIEIVVNEEGVQLKGGG